MGLASVDEAWVRKVLRQNVPAKRTNKGKILKEAGMLWSARPETASKIRNRLELVLDWAKAHGYRKGDNPARWNGNLETRSARPRLRSSAQPRKIICTG